MDLSKLVVATVQLLDAAIWVDGFWNHFMGCLELC